MSASFLAIASSSPIDMHSANTLSKSSDTFASASALSTLDQSAGLTGAGGGAGAWVAGAVAGWLFGASDLLHPKASSAMLVHSEMVFIDAFSLSLGPVTSPDAATGFTRRDPKLSHDGDIGDSSRRIPRRCPAQLATFPAMTNAPREP